MPKIIDGERRYGVWAGDPEGQPEDKTRCIKEVWPDGSWIPHPRQCRRNRGHGKNGLYCKQHAKIVDARGEVEERI